MTETGNGGAGEQSHTPSSLERLAEQVLDNPLEGEGDTAVPGEIARVLLQESYKGTFPHPDVLRRLNEVVENGAERAFGMTEIEQRHRHECDSRWLEAEIRYKDAETAAIGRESVDRRLIIWLVFIFLTLSLIGGFWAAMAGHSLGVGLAGGAGVLTALAGIWASRKKKDPEGNS
ncbi:DUF2335 domain-containing protein [Micromonospora coerulea]|uniref:DUF2335 domain-containing protein n=1 Tax=Micromonospora coerulea TaxID=47856 RepID=UPI00190619DA